MTYGMPSLGYFWSHLSFLQPRYKEVTGGRGQIEQGPPVIHTHANCFIREIFLKSAHSALSVNYRLGVGSFEK